MKKLWIAIVVFVLGVAQVAVGASHTWTGTNSGSWSDPGNWGGTAPFAGDDLFFPEAASNPSMTNDLAPGFQVRSLVFQATTKAYSLEGSALSLGAGGLSTVALSGGANHTLGAPITLTTGATPLVVAGLLTISGTIDGVGGFTKTGSSRLTLTGNNIYTGVTTVSAGLLLVNGSQPSSPITVATTATNPAHGLWGTGTVGPVTVVSGYLNPSPGRTGILTVSGGVSLAAVAQMFPSAQSTTPGSGHAQLAASGAVALAGALRVNLNPLSTRGSVYTIVTAAGGVTGTFNGVPEGGTVLSTNYHSLKVSYAADGGHAVTLTDLGVDPRLSLGASPAAPCTGQAVTFTATTTTSGNPAATGSVTFKDGGTALGSEPLNGSGVATLTVPALSVGNHPITAEYAGDGLYLPGTGAIDGGFSMGVLQSPFVVAPASLPSGATGTASVAPRAGSNFAWTASNGSIDSGEGTSAVTFTAGSEGVTTLTVVESLATGCVTKPGLATVAIAEATPPVVANTWQDLGPGGGQIYTVVIDPSTPSTIWAGTISGAFKSMDAGGHWTKMFSSAAFAYGLAVHPTNGRIVFLSDRNRQIYKSTNGGSSWTLSSGGITALSTGSGFGSIRFKPGDPTVLYFAWTSGLYKSSDSGASWTPSDAGPVNAKSVLDLAVDPASPETVYLALASDGLFRSSDGGTTWSPRNSGLPTRVSGATLQVPLTTFAVDPSNGQRLYVSSGVDSRLYASTDGGTTWTARTGSFPMTSRSLVVAPGDGQTLYCSKRDTGGTNPTYLTRIHKSTDGGATWTSVTDSIWSGGEARPFAIPLSSPSTLYVSVGGALGKTVDAGSSWANASFGLRAAEVGGVAFSPSNPSTWYAHLAALGIMRTTDGGASMSPVNQNIVDPVNGTVIVDPANPQVLLTAGSTKEGWFDWNYGDNSFFDLLVRSADGGATWSQTTNPVPNWDAWPDLQPWGFVAIPTTPTTFFVAGAADGVYKSVDAGLTFYAKNTGLPAGTGVFAYYADLAAADTTGTTLFAAVYNSTANGIYRTTNGGDTWALSGTGIPANTPGRSVAVHPTAPLRVFAACQNAGVFVSDDGGNTWTAATGGIPVTGAMAVAIAPSDANVVVATGFASNVTWVSRSTDGGATWTTVTTSGLDLAIIWRLAIDPSNSNRIIAAGRGGLSALTIDPGDPLGNGIPAAVEAQVPSLGGVGTGDGNGDGISDDLQSNVASIPGSVGAEWVTVASASGTALSGATATAPPDPSALPAGVTVPSGTAEFTVGGVAPGACTVVTLLFPTNPLINSYFKYGSTPDDTTPHWYNFAFDGITGAEVFQVPDRTRVVLHLCDGRRGDGDVVANGFIVDPGGPAVVAGCTTPETPVPTNDGPACEGGTIALTTPEVPGATYSWVGPDDFASGARNPVLTNVTPTMAGDYFVSVTVGGCTSAPGKTIAVVNPRPGTPVLTAPPSVGPGQSFPASVPEVAGLTYGWVVTNGMVTAGSGAAQVTIRAGDLGPVTIAVTAEDPLTQCLSGAASVSIPVELITTRYYAVSPCRLFDTRLSSGVAEAAPALAPGETRTFTVGTRCGLSSLTLRSLSVNQTVTRPTADGELVLYRGDLTSEPITSSITYRAGRTRANNGILELSRSDDGTFKVHNRSTGSVDFILDVNGAFK